MNKQQPIAYIPLETEADQSVPAEAPALPLPCPCPAPALTPEASLAHHCVFKRLCPEVMRDAVLLRQG
jgi:hypothetical protein